MRLPERHARLGAGGAGGDERLGLAPAAVGRERRTFEPIPGAAASDHALGPRDAPRTLVLGFGQGRQPAAFGVTVAASAAAARAAATQLRARPSRSRTASRVPAGACERRQLRLRTQSLGAELDADLGGLARAHARQTVATASSASVQRRSHRASSATNPS